MIIKEISGNLEELGAVGLFKQGREGQNNPIFCLHKLYTIFNLVTIRAKT